VFDFGGGTTDFAIGLYRLPTEEEEEVKGWEKVVDILDTAGDPSLGGEELVRLMVYETVKANRDKFLNGGDVIPFERRDIFPHFPGFEELFAGGAIARENSYTLGEKLRHIWEGDKFATADANISEQNIASSHTGAKEKETIDLTDMINATIDKINLDLADMLKNAPSSSPGSDGNEETIKTTFASASGKVVPNIELDPDVPALRAMLKSG
ncbi:MAG: hypothetical protein K2H64_05315, partial [Desulfovibrio sp.]|nr:hypothetical protein [Desulfovibrio sp.]